MRKFLFFLARILTQIFLECIFKVMQIYSRWLIQDAVLTTHEAPSIPAQCSLQSYTLPCRFVFKSRALTKNYFYLVYVQVLDHSLLVLCHILQPQITQEDEVCPLQSQTRICRSTQRHFLENICSEDDLKSRFFGTFVVSVLLACLSQNF